MTDGRLYREARKRVKLKRGFFVHLAVYLLMGAFFFLMNITTDPRDVWFIFPMMPWGVGLGIHYLAVFGFPGTKILSKEWEDREIQREIYRMSGRKRGRNDMERLPPGSLDEDEMELRELEKKPNWTDRDFV